MQGKRTLLLQGFPLRKIGDCALLFTVGNNKKIISKFARKKQRTPVAAFLQAQYPRSRSGEKEL